ncbi:MAG: hypothetical protein EZS28_022574, partial [Streblomastix strix]
YAEAIWGTVGVSGSIPDEEFVRLVLEIWPDQSVWVRDGDWLSRYDCMALECVEYYV